MQRGTPVADGRIVKNRLVKKTKRDHCLVTLSKAHYNAAAFTRRQLGGEHVERRHVIERSCKIGNAPALYLMNNTVVAGKRLVVRAVLLQMGCAVLVAIVFGMLQGAAPAWSGLAGGLIVAIGTGLFGWRMFAPGIAPAALLRRAMVAAEMLKWFWYVLAVWAAFARLKLAPLPLLTGLVAAQLGLFGLVRMKRGKTNGSV